MDIAIKSKPADQIRLLAERYPDAAPAELAKKGDWSPYQVASALRARKQFRPKSRAS